MEGWRWRGGEGGVEREGWRGKDGEDGVERMGWRGWGGEGGVRRTMLVVSQVSPQGVRGGGREVLVTGRWPLMRGEGQVRCVRVLAMRAASGRRVRRWIVGRSGSSAKLRVRGLP